ncbi:MAG: hypothetical protein WDA71_07815 [Actinomycetota bacterium]
MKRDAFEELAGGPELAGGRIAGEDSSPARPSGLRDWVRFFVVFWQAIVGALAIVAGGVAIFFGWWGVSGTVLLPVQNTYMVSGGITGLALVVFGSVLLLSFQVARQNALVKCLILLETREPAARVAEAPKESVTAEVSLDGRQVVVPRGAHSYHRPTCVYAVGKSVTTHLVGAAGLKSFKPCGVCDPPRSELQAQGPMARGPRTAKSA